MVGSKVLRMGVPKAHADAGIRAHHKIIHLPLLCAVWVVVAMNYPMAAAPPAAEGRRTAPSHSTG